MKKELYKNRFFLIPVIIATIISIIVVYNHVQNTYSDIEDYSIWSNIGYIVMVSIIDNKIDVKNSGKNKWKE